MAGGPVGALDRIAAAWEEAGASLWRRRPFVLATIGAIAVLLAFPAVVVLALARASDGVESLRARERLRVFLAQEASPSEIEDVRRALAEAEGIAGVEVVGAADAREAFLRSFPDLAPVVREMKDEELAFPSSVEAWGPASPLALASLARRVEGMPGVEEVRHDAGAAEKLDALASRLRAAAWAAGCLALLATAFGIGSVIRMGALARREQLAVMRLVGAPRLHVRLPFILEGLVQGALAGALAGALVALVGRLLSGALRALGPDAARLPPAAWAVLVVAPALAGALSGWISVEAVLRRHAQLER